MTRHIDTLLSALTRLVQRIDYYAKEEAENQATIEGWQYTQNSSDMQRARAVLSATADPLHDQSMLPLCTACGWNAIDIADETCMLCAKRASASASNVDAQPIEQHAFHNCVFAGPTPEGFDSWLHWTDGPRLENVRITSLAAPTPELRIAELTAQLASAEKRVSELGASRIAYANEFPLNSEGEPDVGNIHANIRALKARLADKRGTL